MTAVLIVSGGYLPGYKYGGPVRSLAALVDQLGDEIEFSVVTSGSEMGESEPYHGVQLDCWSRVGKADVWYTMSRRLSPWFWRRIITDRQPDVIYLNSFFDPVANALMCWRRLGLLSGIPVLLAPRGEFSVGALAQKATKKNTFVRLSRMLRLRTGVVYQSSTSIESEDIRRSLGSATDVFFAPDLIVRSHRA